MQLNKSVSVYQLNERARGHLPGNFGIEFTELSQGRLKSSMNIKDELLAPNGYLHAASLIALADTTCGFGAFSHLPDKAKSFTTIELKSNFLGTQTSGVITCEANLVHGGRTTQVWDATIYDESHKKITLFRCTQLMIY